jgi:hypothetical protein
MKTLVLLLASSGWFLCTGQQAGPIASQCLERLSLPDYPPLGVAARPTGDVIVEVRISDPLASADVKIEGKPHPVLFKAVWEALRASTFAASCRWQRLKLAFTFAIEGDAVENRQPPKVFLGYPNRFWIVTPPVRIQP